MMKELSGRYSNPEIALNTGGVLKEMLRYEPLARILLYSEESVFSTAHTILPLCAKRL
jgi:hypothetical protein